MREIRFRVWDKETKVMETWEELAFRECPTLEQVLRNHYAQYEIMQYTGLKDRHGKEIYEGDILRGESEQIEVVRWEKDICQEYGCVGWSGVRVDGWAGPAHYKLEVIGNIYEHSELLKDQQNNS